MPSNTITTPSGKVIKLPKRTKAEKAYLKLYGDNAISSRSTTSTATTTPAQAPAPSVKPTARIKKKAKSAKSNSTQSVIPHPSTLDGRSRSDYDTIIKILLRHIKRRQIELDDIKSHDYTPVVKKIPGHKLNGLLSFAGIYYNYADEVKSHLDKTVERQLL